MTTKKETPEQLLDTRIKNLTDAFANLIKESVETAMVKSLIDATTSKRQAQPPTPTASPLGQQAQPPTPTASPLVQVKQKTVAQEAQAQALTPLTAAQEAQAQAVVNTFNRLNPQQAQQVQQAQQAQPPIHTGPAVAPFTTSEEATAYVMKKCVTLGSDKATQITGIIRAMGYTDINQLPPEQFGNFYIKVEAIQ